MRKLVLLLAAFGFLLVSFGTACDDIESVKADAEKVKEDIEKAAKDLPRLGDAMLIGEALEATVCTSQGSTWDKTANKCR